MRWSFKVARIAGIDIQVHATFLLLLVWVAVGYWKAYGSINAVIDGVSFIILLFLCIVLHELGHALTARHYGIGTRNITLLPIGGVAALEKMPDDPAEEIKVALAGPAVNIIIALAIWLALQVIGVQLTESQLTQPNTPLLLRLMAVNLIIALFNLVPAFPMDGGRVLRALLTFRFGHTKATELAAKVGQAFALLMFLMGLIYNPFLILIALFVWFGATAETTAETLKYHLGEISVANAMVREFHSLHLEDSLQKAIDLTIQTTQKDFPVVDNSQPGVIYQLTQNELVEGIKALGNNASISQLKLKPVPTTGYKGRVDKLFMAMSTSGTSMVAVIEQQQLVGIIDLDNIYEIIKLKHPA